MVKNLITFVMCSILLISFVSAITGSMGNARMILYPKVGTFGTTIQKTILVKNLNDVPINVTLVADANFSKMVTIYDKNFILEPDQEKKAAFSINVKKEGDYEGKINVFFDPADGKGAGVALSSQIIIHASSNGEEDGADTEIGDETDQGSDILTDDSNSNNLTINTASNKEKPEINPILYVAFISTLVLAVILVLLIVVMNKKKKRSVRSSWKS